MVASRVFVTLGLVALLLAILFLLIYIYVTQARSVTLLLVVAACGGAGGFSECSVVAFLVELDMPLREVFE